MFILGLMLRRLSEHTRPNLAVSSEFLISLIARLAISYNHYYQSTVCKHLAQSYVTTQNHTVKARTLL